ncbi:MAG: TAT-variant-translocated molybdopterin oxidoreductase [Bryobacterales bacterium]|nr:TAT-variant-translocated molybdopterin oxidoreductase [Bryobacterales bacterium]
MADQNSTHYWKSLAERAGGPDFSVQAETEFASSPLRSIEPDPGRRAFLKAAGFSFAASVMAGCSRAPVQRAMPYLDQPGGVIAGRPVYYASTCAGCAAGCGVLVKTRDGRPIKLEGNPEHPLSRGGLCAAGQASILGLYDSLRLKHPLMEGKQAAWQKVDEEILRRLKGAGAVRVLSHTVNSPTALWAIAGFLAQFKDGRHVMYDPLSCSAIPDAHEQTHGVRAVPHYRFDRAEVIVSFDADFLGTWISPVEYTAAYRAGRDAEATRRSCWHAQFESRLSITGSKADRRVRLAPIEVERSLHQLASLVESGAPQDAPPHLQEAAARLRKAAGRSLVVCGIQSAEAQVLCNTINHKLGNYGATVDLEKPSRQRAGSDRALASLLEELRGGKVDALFILGANPVAELPGGVALAAHIRKLPLSVSIVEREDESAAATRFVCPDHHYLESWSDAEPVAGVVSFTQPVIRPLGGTRSSIESFSLWSGRPKTAQELVRERWSGKVNWEESLRNGFARIESPAAAPRAFKAVAVPPREAKPAEGYELVLYPKAGMLDGRHAYNPWLHELPDPITKITWDNYACLAPAAAAKLGVAEGDVVRIEGGPVSVELPAVLQPGQDERTVAVALGYGRKASARFAKVGPAWLDSRGASVGANGLVGTNCAGLLAFDGASLRYSRAGIRIVRTGRRQALAATQDHHTLAAPGGGPARPIIQETRLAELTKHERKHETHPDLWPEDHPYTGHKWAMAIDLDACTGCSACVIACQVENNVPVTGKDEVRRKRAMHWLRIDRYYTGTPDEVEVAHQPMLCQQCDNATCETVCPVLATVHSSEGLNQQIYNRCVGTRYCANNCAYKARRFNWFDYPRDDRLANMVLNPDVTIRSRGVMEKCTFCVQRIQQARLEARRRGEPLRDGDIRTACQQSCPAQAIVFGDMNDPNSKVSRLMRSGRAYKVLEEINVRPAVTYLKIVRNRTREGGES